MTHVINVKKKYLQTASMHDIQPNQDTYPQTSPGKQTKRHYTKKTTKQTKKASFFLLFYTIIFNHTFFGVICDVLRNLRTQKHKNQKCSILLQENITDLPTFKKIQV